MKDGQPYRMSKRAANFVMIGIFAAAKRITSHYMKVVAPAQPRSGAERVLIPILQAGVSEESLLRSCDGCREQTSPRSRA